MFRASPKTQVLASNIMKDLLCLIGGCVLALTVTICLGFSLGVAAAKGDERIRRAIESEDGAEMDANPCGGCQSHKTTGCALGFSGPTNCNNYRL